MICFFVRKNVGFYGGKCDFKNDIGPVRGTPIT
jgi:hypothetical protein